MGGSSWIFLPTRYAIYHRDNYKCLYCGKQVQCIDHIFPKSRGGKNNYENLASSCFNCNKIKGEQTIEECRGKDFSDFLLSLLKDQSQYLDFKHGWNKAMEKPWFSRMYKDRYVRKFGKDNL